MLEPQVERFVVLFRPPSIRRLWIVLSQLGLVLLDIWGHRSHVLQYSEMGLRMANPIGADSFPSYGPDALKPSLVARSRNTYRLGFSHIVHAELNNFCT